MEPLPRNIGNVRLRATRGDQPFEKQPTLSVPRAQRRRSRTGFAKQSQVFLPLPWYPRDVDVHDLRRHTTPLGVGLPAFEFVQRLVGLALY